MQRSAPASLLALGILPATVAAQVTFTGLGKLTGADHCYARSLSADGLTASGYCAMTTTNHAFRWHAGVLHDLGVPQGTIYSEGGPLNPSGTIMVGMMGPLQRPARWTLATGAFQDLGFPANTNHVPQTISADGSTIWGFGGSNPTTSRVFRWIAATGVQYLPLVPGFVNSAGGHATPDGSIVVGVTSAGGPGNPPQAVRWVNGVPSIIPLPPGYTSANFTAVSADGQVATGSLYIDPPLTQNMHRWTLAGGWQNLGGEFALGWAMNADGSVIVGYSAFAAAMWTSDTGLVSLSAHLSSLGANLTGWTLDAAYGISADGRTILGQGTHNGVQEGWIATLPGACYANCDGSIVVPVLTANDFQCFLNRFAAADSQANCDGSTGTPALTANDFQCFINSYAAGCPQ